MKAMSRAGFLTAAVCLLLAATSVRAQAPSITSTSPQAVKPGESVDVTINGVEPF